MATETREMAPPVYSYYDLYIATREVPRSRLFDLPVGYTVTCTRTDGWELWRGQTLVAGEFHPDGLHIEVGDVTIVNSLAEKNG